MRHRRDALRRRLAAGALPLLLVCAPLATAEAAGCDVHHQPFVEGGVAQGTMRVVNDGTGCAFTFKFGGNFEPSDWKIEVAPAHGRIEIATGQVTYVPAAGYVGLDAFTLAVFGFNPMLAHGHRARDGRFAFKVVVRRSSL